METLYTYIAKVIQLMTMVGSSMSPSVSNAAERRSPYHSHVPSKEANSTHVAYSVQESNRVVVRGESGAHQGRQVHKRKVPR